MGPFGVAHRHGVWEAAKRPQSLKFPTHPTMMKLDTVIPYSKKIQTHINHLAHLLSSANISILSPEINNSCYIK